MEESVCSAKITATDLKSQLFQIQNNTKESQYNIQDENREIKEERDVLRGESISLRDMIWYSEKEK